jgi:hypothetical protein
MLIVTVPLKVVAAISLALILLSSPMPLQTTEGASQLTQGDYTVIVNLSGNGGSITDSSSITTTIHIAKPDQPAFDYVDNRRSDFTYI